MRSSNAEKEETLEDDWMKIEDVPDKEEEIAKKEDSEIDDHHYRNMISIENHHLHSILRHRHQQ